MGFYSGNGVKTSLSIQAILDGDTDIVKVGGPNVSQFGWTTNDLTSVKDILTYVKTAIEAAEIAQNAAESAAADRDRIEQLDGDYQIKLQDIDTKYETIVDLSAEIAAGNAASLAQVSAQAKIEVDKLLGVPDGATQLGTSDGSNVQANLDGIKDDLSELDVRVVALEDREIPDLADTNVTVQLPFTDSPPLKQSDLNKIRVSIYAFGVAANGSATGGTDDTTAFQTALDYCASTNKTLYLDGAKLFIAGTLRYQFKRHSIEGGNATLFVADNSSNVFNLLGHTVPGTAVSSASAYTFGGFSMYPGVAAVVRTNRTAFLLGSPTFDCGGCASDNVSLSGFNIGLTFGSNSYIHNFTKWKFTRCNKNVYYPTGLANSGENINFSHCVFANSDTNIEAGGDCVINVRDSSFDYSPEKIYAHAGGIVKANNCWFEGNDDVSVWVHTLNQLSTVILDKCTFVVAGARTKYLFDGATPQGGVILRDPMITTTGAPSYSNTTWGSNFTYVYGTPIYRRSDVSNDTIPFAMNMSSTVSPNFNLTFTDSSRSDFSLRPANGGTTNRNEITSVAAGVTYDSSANYLLLQPPTGNVSRITRNFLAAPGATVTASAYVMSSFSNSTDQLDLNLYFCNPAGVTISVYNKRYNSVTFNSTPTRINLLRGVSAPQGTAYIMFEITTTNPAVDGGSYHRISNFSVEAGSGIINLPYETTQSPSTGFIPYVYGGTSTGSATYTVQRGSYTLIGNLVFVNMAITWTGHTGTGSMKIGALPYLTDFPSGEVLNVMSSGITTAGTLIGVMDAYSNSLVINQQTSAGVVAAFPVAAAGTLQVTGVYRRC